MSGTLAKQGSADGMRLNDAQYVPSLIQEACRLNLLSEAELELIRLRMIELLKRQVERYTGGESSSVREETAQNLIRSALFSIGLYFKSLRDDDERVLALKNTKMTELYQKSRPLLKKQIADARVMLKMVQNNRLRTDNIAYNDTIDRALPGFFKTYDMEFASDEITAAIDYPLCLDKMEAAGIEYISGYLKKLYYENLFCRKFSETDIGMLLNGYDRRHRELLINIFLLVLKNSLGSALLGHSARRLEIRGSDREGLSKMLSRLGRTELYAALKNAAGRLMEELDIESGFLREYLLCAVREILPELQNALKHDSLGAVFPELRD